MTTADPRRPLSAEELSARLKAAGVTDQTSFEAALARDPDLRAAVAAQQAATLSDLVKEFNAVDDQEQMLAFWRRVPSAFEEPLIQAIEAALHDAPPDDDRAAIENLSAKLDDFKRLCAQAQAQTDQPPVLQALIDFANAPDEAAARDVFDRHRELLQPFEAQRILDKNAQANTETDFRPRLLERAALLRELRGAAPAQLSQVSETREISSTPPTRGGNTHFGSAIAEGGGNATVVNNVYLQNLQRIWTRPRPPALTRDAVARPAPMQALRDELAKRGTAALTGVAPALAVQGAPGVGKTTLAHLLAMEQDAAGVAVIWEDLGPDFLRPEQTQAVLRRWAGYATNFFGLPENLNKLFTFEPDAVRALLGEHPPLLIVLDNVWSTSAIAPLRSAIPPGAQLIITTRKQDLAQQFGAGIVEVGLLTDDEALDLFMTRLRWQPARPAYGWVFDLIGSLNRHALGLDVALGVLGRYGKASNGQAPTIWAKKADELTAAVRSGDVGRLHLGDDDPGHNVQAVLMFSYDALKPEAQQRFRRLGAFAPEADFHTDLAAAAWGCVRDAALETLTDFANAALLDRRGDGVWKQHALLRALALALLGETGEVDAAAQGHARAFGDAMHRAERKQHYYQMLPSVSQLRHAFAWAVENDLDLAQKIAENCANMQKQFGLAREGEAWSERILAAAKNRANPASLARAWGHWANSLGELANLPGEDRAARLNEALYAHDEALRHRRPENAPLAYATTQNNRATILSELATIPGEDRAARLNEALHACDDALRYRRPDNTPLAHARTLSNRATILRDLASLPGQDRAARLVESLRSYDDALRYIRPDNAPLDYATILTNRANNSSELASLTGENRAARLVESLRAYGDALCYIRPDNAPLYYATIQNNRANILRDLGSQPGEDRVARLNEALRAYDDALRYRRPDNVPLDYATTENNRANILSELASLPGEDRAARLTEALRACDDALRHRRPDNVPLDYATTENNRANILSELASLPGEDRVSRLNEALRACDNALRCRRPDNAPLDYAQTLLTRAIVLRDVSSLSDENRTARLNEALSACDDALCFIQPDNAPLDYATAQNNRAIILSDLARLPGEDRVARLNAALRAHDGTLLYTRLDNAPLDYAQTQSNRANILSELSSLPGEDRRALLTQALRYAAEAAVLFEHYQQVEYLAVGRRVLGGLRNACGDDFEAWWAETELGEVPEWLIESGQASGGNLPEELATALREYVARKEEADKLEIDPDAWQRAADVGEGVLSALGAAAVSNLQVDELRAAFPADLASVYNMLGNALDEVDKIRALAAYERAITLQPDFAMWQRNRAVTLLELGRLDEAAAAIARARELEPDAPRLTQLEPDLAAKKGETPQ